MSTPKSKLPLCINACCGSCEKWAIGIGSGGDQARGRCTNALSIYHEQVMDHDDNCGTWSPLDDKLLVRH